jgi:hypothetical protein
MMESMCGTRIDTNTEIVPKLAAHAAAFLVASIILVLLEGIWQPLEVLLLTCTA